MPPIETVSVRAGTTAEWADVDATDGAASPILAVGELGINRTTGDMKIGDGVTAFASLPGGAGGTAAFVAAPLAAITGGEAPTEAEFNLLRGTVAGIRTALIDAGLMASS